MVSDYPLLLFSAKRLCIADHGVRRLSTHSPIQHYNCLGLASGSIAGSVESNPTVQRACFWSRLTLTNLATNARMEA